MATPNYNALFGEEEGEFFAAYRKLIIKIERTSEPASSLEQHPAIVQLAQRVLQHAPVDMGYESVVEIIAEACAIDFTTITYPDIVHTQNTQTRTS